MKRQRVLLEFNQQMIIPVEVQLVLAIAVLLRTETRYRLVFLVLSRFRILWIKSIELPPYPQFRVNLSTSFMVQGRGTTLALIIDMTNSTAFAAACD